MDTLAVAALCAATLLALRRRAVALRAARPR
jgi:hypothetical protein